MRKVLGRRVPARIGVGVKGRGLGMPTFGVRAGSFRRLTHVVFSYLISTSFLSARTFVSGRSSVLEHGGTALCRLLPLLRGGLGGLGTGSSGSGMGTVEGRIRRRYVGVSSARVKFCDLAMPANKKGALSSLM